MQTVCVNMLGILLVAVSAMGTLPTTQPVAAPPVRIAPGAPQLFVDDALIESSQSLRRTLRTPRKDDGGDRPVIALEREFEDTPATLEANGTILYDPRLKRYVMFALAFASVHTGYDRVRLYRFTSADGMNWTKGDADGGGYLVHPTSPDDLLDRASGARAGNLDLFSCHYNADDAQYPYKGWFWYANWGPQREGLYFVRSADGRKWERGLMVAGLSSRTIEQPDAQVPLLGPGDVTTLHPDLGGDRFLAAAKFNAAKPVGEPATRNYLRSRAFVFVDRLDQPIDVQRINRVALVPAAKEANGDQPHDEYYGSVAWRYGPLWLGELKVWHGGGDYPYSAAGCAFSKFAFSRDGLHWQKVPFANERGDAEVFLPNGQEGGNDGRNDGGYMTLFSQGPLRIGDELILYYGSSSWGKNHAPGKRITGGGIFRARMRPDGFVSVDGGTLTTRPLALEGVTLLVNAVGPVEVEALDAAGRSVARASLTGDSLRHAIPLPRGAAPLRLRFSIGEGGQLYSFKAE